MTRAEWLATLATGSPVSLRTPIKTYSGTVERIEAERVWVIVAFGDALIFATWVDRTSGANSSAGAAIFPPSDETANEALQGDGNRDPLPNHSRTSKIDSRPVVGRLNGIGDAGAKA